MKDIKVIKRNGNEVSFDSSKITKAVEKAILSLDGNLTQRYIAENVTKSIESYIEYHNILEITVEKIQDLVEEHLMLGPRQDIAKEYIRYRYKREMVRSQYDDLMQVVGEKLNATNVQNQNANVDEHSFGGRMGEMNSAVARKYALDYIVSPMAKENHLSNRIYIHDLDNYAVGMHNCLSIPFDKLLANGFNTRQTDIRPAQSISTAFQLVAVIFQLQSLQQFGGVSATHLDWTMVPYVRKSFAKHYLTGLKYFYGIDNPVKEDVDAFYKCSIDDTFMYDRVLAYDYAMDMTEREVRQAVEAMYHNLK